MARQERDTLRVQLTEYDDGWRWRAVRGTRVVAAAKEAYARRDSAMRAARRVVRGMAAELGLIVQTPLAARKRPVRR